MSDSNTQATAYWKENLAIIVKIMVVWFVVSFGFGILLVDQLNAITIGGYKLGFWFAQQGSIYIFVALIFYQNYQQDKIDDDAGV